MFFRNLNPCIKFPSSSVPFTAALCFAMNGSEDKGVLYTGVQIPEKLGIVPTPQKCQCMEILNTLSGCGY